ncbi:hypothetical protein VKT23_014150 [Stygiomarasmius scandens]|uniref:Uncharacterized protein n=1 Tax=Marasmiellus scandens TaxID=2682957 RepID=A0ABR1J1W8_9AGAR
MSSPPNGQNQTVQPSAEELKQIGELLTLIGQLAVKMAVVFMIYGIYLAFTLLSAHVLLSRGIIKSKARLALFLVTVFELLVSTTYVVLVFVLDASTFTTMTATQLANPQWFYHFAWVLARYKIGLDFTTRLNVRVAGNMDM